MLLYLNFYKKINGSLIAKTTGGSLHYNLAATPAKKEVIREVIDLSAGKIICNSKNIEKEFLLGYIEKKFFTIRTANKGTLVEPIGYTLNLCVLEDDYDFISHIQGDKRDFVCELYNGEKYSIEGCLFENMSNGFITFECDKCTKKQ